MKILKEFQEAEFIAKAVHQEVMDYIAGNILAPDAELALVKRGNKAEIIAYTAMRPFTDAAETVLMECPDSALVRSYIKKNGLGVYAERALLQKGNHEEIMCYLSRGNFSRGKSARLLLKRGNHEEIMCSISRGRFDDAAEVLLVLRNNADELKAYSNRYTWGMPAQRKMKSRKIC